MHLGLHCNFSLYFSSQAIVCWNGMEETGQFPPLFFSLRKLDINTKTTRDSRHWLQWKKLNCFFISIGLVGHFVPVSDAQRQSRLGYVTSLFLFPSVTSFRCLSSSLCSWPPSKCLEDRTLESSSSSACGAKNPDLSSEEKTLGTWC